jgi:hypothetical protein
MANTHSHDKDQLKRYLKRLLIQQTHDLKLLSDYKRKKIPQDASFIVGKRNETRYRKDRIANLKTQLQYLDKSEAS